MAEGLWSEKSVLDMVVREIVFIGLQRAADERDDDLFHAETEHHKNLFKIALYPNWIQQESKITGQELSLHHGQLDPTRATVTIPTHCSNT